MSEARSNVALVRTWQMLRTTLLAITLCACANDTPDPKSPAPVEQGIDKDRAVVIATETGRTEGYDPALYNLTTVEFESKAGSFQNMWRVFFELKPPGRPGGHFTVYVTRNGTPRLVHGK